MSLSDRVKKLLQQKGMTQNDLAQKLNVSKVQINKVVLGKTKNPRNIIEMSKVFGVSPDWLLEGKGNDSEDRLPFYQEPLHDEIEIQVAKSLDFIDEDGSISDASSVIDILRDKKENYPADSHMVCTIIDDASMSPVMNQGAIAFINANDKKILSGKVYAIEFRGWKRICKLKKSADKITALAEDPRVISAVDMNHDEITVIGRVIMTSNPLD